MSPRKATAQPSLLDDEKPPRKKPRPAMRGTWRCATCDETLTGTWASLERHADAHGGGRIEGVIREIAHG